VAGLEVGSGRVCCTRRIVLVQRTLQYLVGMAESVRARGEERPPIPAEPQLYLLRMLEPETGSGDKLRFMDADT